MRAARRISGPSLALTWPLDKWSSTFATASLNVSRSTLLSIGSSTGQVSTRFNSRRLQEECRRIINTTVEVRNDTALPFVYCVDRHTPLVSLSCSSLRLFSFRQRGSGNGKSHDARMPSWHPPFLALPPFLFFLFFFLVFPSPISLTRHWLVVQARRLRLSLRPSLLLRDTP